MDDSIFGRPIRPTDDIQPPPPKSGPPLPPSKRAPDAGPLLPAHSVRIIGMVAESVIRQFVAGCPLLGPAERLALVRLWSLTMEEAGKLDGGDIEHGEQLGQAVERAQRRWYAEYGLPWDP